MLCSLLKGTTALFPPALAGGKADGERQDAATLPPPLPPPAAAGGPVRPAGFGPDGLIWGQGVGGRKRWGW